MDPRYKIMDRDQFTPESTMQMIQKTDEFTDAVQGEGCGCAGCDATVAA